MPRGKKKLLHPPLTFLHPPFSKPLSEAVRVASSDQYPAVKTASTEEKCTWITPDFSLSARSFFPKGGRRPPVQRNSPKPPLEFFEDPIDQVTTNPDENPTERCPLFPLTSPEKPFIGRQMLVKETPEYQR
ncbi:hypothetical protein X801_07082 [Opisthorchis viverrini]|uniref:Uncharacterized protein n=2 Tax=Opisthorchis viverrini TaxID=6198 RepID=A0A074ZSC1_OPIVI|nr:hypothetical protein T265_06452 [Opisthorchis viverrini]KER26255.1 hypothetical protein T265_06452 [Opisthorchis viverrini]OON17087.1 hypothetical protein X801_07082 [Opisthorchis viverrini]